MKTCPVHADRGAEARCSSCRVPMCVECWRRSVDGAPWCEACIPLLDEPPPVLLFIAFAAVGITMGGLAVRAVPVEALYRWIAFASVAASIAIASGVTYSRTRKARAARVIEERPAAAPVPSPTYRDAARRAVRRLAPPVSGRLATAVVAGTLALTASIVPSVLALPRWIENELVLGLWWLVWTLTFAVLLHRGWRVARDVGRPLRRGRSSASSGRFDLGDLGGLDVGGGGEGCGVVLVILAVVAVTLIASWLLVELVIPAVVVAVYGLVLRGLARVANDRHGCEGRPLRALGWGALWAAVYTAPLAGLVWIVHLGLASRAG